MSPVLELANGEMGPERRIDFTDGTQTYRPAVQEGERAQAW